MVGPLRDVGGNAGLTMTTIARKTPQLLSRRLEQPIEVMTVLDGERVWIHLHDNKVSVPFEPEMRLLPLDEFSDAYLQPAVPGLCDRCDRHSPLPPFPRGDDVIASRQLLPAGA